MKRPPRLPFRLKVPKRDELIAYGLMTLAVGLMVGLAIGPIVNGAATVVPVLLPPTAATAEDPDQAETVAALPPLGSPAGSDPGGSVPAGDSTTTLASDPEPAPAEAPVADLPADDYSSEPASPAGEKPDPKTPDPDPEPKPEGILLTGTVLANSPGSKTYWMESAGDLVTVFAATLPDPGLLISTRVLPLSNGTLAESAQRSAADISKQAVLKGVVSYVDPVAGVAVLSSRGASLPASATSPSALDGYEVGDRVEATLILNVPDPQNFSGTGSGEARPELPIQLEKLRRVSVNEPVELSGSLVAIDQVNGTLTLSADSTGSLTSVVDLQVPEGFPFGMVTTGRRYSATASRTGEGLRLLGLSPASGKAAANDPARAFGTHAG